MKLAKDSFFDSLNDVLEHSALPSFEPCDTSKTPIIYILGVPRSGTTLLSQLMVRHFDVAYANNIMARFWKCPEVGIHLTQTLLPDAEKKEISYSSDYGRSSEVAGPHEFAYFWRHWLPFEQSPTSNISAELLKKVDIVALRKCLTETFLWGFKKAVFFKYLYLGMQSSFLASVFENSFFVYIERNKLDLVRSILHARMDFFGNYEEWFSVKPQAYPFSSSNPCEEVFLQVKHLHQEHMDELSKVENFLHIQYSELCSQPCEVLNNIKDLIVSKGCEIPFEVTDISSFSEHHERLLPEHMENKLKILFGEEYFLPENV